MGSKVLLKFDAIEQPDLSKSPPSTDEPKGISDFSSLPPETQNSVLRQAQERKKMWFERPIPMLEGLTPREAAKTPEGVASLERLIEFYNYSHGGRSEDEITTMMNPSESEIRSELGIQFEDDD